MVLILLQSSLSTSLSVLRFKSKCFLMKVTKTKSCSEYHSCTFKVSKVINMSLSRPRVGITYGNQIKPSHLSQYCCILLPMLSLSSSYAHNYYHTCSSSSYRSRAKKASSLYYQRFPAFSTSTSYRPRKEFQLKPSITPPVINHQLVRLDKYLIDCNVGLRSEVQKLIQNGGVIVNGTVVTTPRHRIKAGAHVHLVAQDENIDLRKKFTLFNKPYGMLSTRNDPLGRPNLSHLMEKYPKFEKYHAVGRLDHDSTGLLILSSLGSFTNLLQNPANEVEREYIAVVEGKVNYELLKLKLANGVETSDGTFKSNLLESHEATVLERDIAIQECQYNLEHGVRDKMLLTEDQLHVADLFTIRLTVCEGKYRMVRRILHNSGHSVVTLRRIRYGNFLLDDIPSGGFREATDFEIDWLKKLYWKLCHSK